MVITDSHGKEKNVASRGLAGTALGFGIGGTALALMNNNSGCNNGILGNLFGGNRDCYVTKYEAKQSQEIAYLASKNYSDEVGLGLYRQLVAEDNKQTESNNRLFRETFTALAALDKETAVNKKEIDKNFELLNQKVDYTTALIDCKIARVNQNVIDNYIPAKKVISLCDICPTPQVLEKVEQPTKVCVG